MNSLEEVSAKLAFIRVVLQETESAGIRLRGTDWFAWATAGGSNTVLLAAETGIAEVLVTLSGAWILTDKIEAQRLQDEQILCQSPVGLPYEFSVNPWANPSQREQFVRDATNGGKILSDRPTPEEAPLPQPLIHQRRVLVPTELERYRHIGKLASEAITEVLTQAQPDWTENQLAGAGANALWSRGLHPVLVLAAGDRRLPLYRHPLPSKEQLGRQAMLVLCVRGHGLIISLTRFVCFEGLSTQDQTLHRTIAEIEAVALSRCRVKTPLNEVYNALETAYKQHGYPSAIYEHHQGGTAGYGAREVIATPNTTDCLTANMAIAWNPSIPGAKIEDTFIVNLDNSLENLSFDPAFPHCEIAGRLRPVPLER